MTTESPSPAAAGSPGAGEQPAAAGFDPVRVAAALRSSPHLAFVAPAGPGDESVWFRDTHGTGYALAPTTTTDPAFKAERTEGRVYAWDAVAAALGNHPHVASAALARKGFGLERFDAVTVRTRTGDEYTLDLTLEPRPGYGTAPADPADPADPAADVASAADKLLAGDPSATGRATAGLLHHIAATWDNQDHPLREHAQNVARALPQHRSEG